MPIHISHILRNFKPCNRLLTDAPFTNNITHQLSLLSISEFGEDLTGIDLFRRKIYPFHNSREICEDENLCSRPFSIYCHDQGFYSIENCVPHDNYLIALVVDDDSPERIEYFHQLYRKFSKESSCNCHNSFHHICNPLLPENSYHKIVAGYIAYKINKFSEVVVDWAMVSPPYREEGIGRLLINCVIDHVRHSSFSVDRLNLRCLHSSRGFYEKIGFKQIENMENVYENEVGDFASFILADIWKEGETSLLSLDLDNVCVSGIY